MVPSKSDALIGMVLGSPEPGLSNLAWVAPIDELSWSAFDAAYWKTRQVPKALADAVGYDGPRTTLRLQLAHEKQRPSITRTFPVSFEYANGGANTAHSAPFFAEYGTIFENPRVEVIEKVGTVTHSVSIVDLGRRASLNLNLTPAAGSSRVAFKGTVTLQQVKEIPAFQGSAMVDFSLREKGGPIGERTVEVRSEGVFETFKLLDQSNREFASGRIGQAVSDGRTVTKVTLADSRVTINISPAPSVPMPPPTISVQ